MSRRLKRWAGWTLGTLVVFGGLGYWVQRSLWSVQIVEVSHEEVREITGDDLRWSPPIPSKPVVDIGDIDKTTKDRLVSYRAGRLPAEALKEAAAIDKTWEVTAAVERLIAGKEPKNAVIDRRMNDAIFMLRTDIGVAYRGQFNLCLARGNHAKAIDVFQRATKFYEFLRPRYTASFYVTVTVRQAIRVNSFSETQLRTMYSSMRPESGFDTAMSYQLKYEYNCIAELLRTTSAAELEETLSYGSGSQRTPLSGQLDKRRTLIQLAKLYREALRNSILPRNQRKWPVSDAYAVDVARIPQHPDIDATDPPWENWWKAARYRWKMRSVRNVLGLSFLDATLQFGGPKFNLDVESSGLNMWEGCRQVLALQIYRKVHGRYPASLDDLKSLGLPGAEPVDLFASAPFRYDVKRNICWSVGENGKDDGGSTARVSDAPADVVFTLP